MAKNKNSLNWILTLILIIFLVAIIVLVILGFKLGWFARFFVPTGIDKDSFDTLPVGDCELDFNKELYCEDELIYAKLTDGKNAQCIVGQNYNNEGWKLVREDGKILIINTDEYGKYSASARAGKAGLYTYAVICLDEDKVLCRTNDVDIEVEVCPDDGYTCGWVGNQCGGTCPDTHPLCVDVWFENNALFGDDGYVACVCLNPDTEEVHPDWKPDGQYHDDSGYPDGNCYDTDPSQDVHLFGTCTPIGGTAEPDFCPTSTAVTQLFCSSDGTSCMGASTICPSGEVCVGGVCVAQLEYKDNIDPSEALPGLTYGEEDYDGCVSSSVYVNLCKTYVDSNVDSAHCEGDTERMIDCSEGWNNCGSGVGEGDWYCCNFDTVDLYLQDDCCGKSGCDVVCERWYQAGS